MTSTPSTKRVRVVQQQQQNNGQQHQYQHRGADSQHNLAVLTQCWEMKYLDLVGIEEEDKHPLPTWGLLMDLDALEESLRELKQAFDEECPGAGTWLHTFAVKANPVLPLLRMVVKEGHGLECASLNEVELAIKAGCEAHKIMFDSPCKTVHDLKRALQLGVHINADSFEELERARKLYGQSTSTIGLRINPLLGSGTIQALSVSTATSKFGVPLTPENKARVLLEYRNDKRLTALHAHVGSQGCSLDMLANGAKSLVTLAREIGFHQIKTIDIGGGLPANFSSDETTPTLREYAKHLTQLVPELGSGGNGEFPRLTWITEFGRALVTKCGWVASRVEYIKKAGGVNIAVVHAGSDMFVRTCYCPDQFPLRIQACRVGERPPMATTLAPFKVVGPLCFGGDVIANSADLPSDLSVGDCIIVRDAGANCFSLWSRHCSRSSPPVLGYRIHDGKVLVSMLRAQETTDEVLRFWGM